MSGAALALVRTRLQVPLYRNGYALVASSALTSALGLVFWLLAARAYPAATVGLNAALISAMTLLADLAQLDLKSALNRFLPTAGSATARLTARVYVLVLVLSAVAAAIFLAGAGWWSPALAFLNRGDALWFVVATMAWTIFVLQDSVLAGIRQAALVPVENLVFAVAKIGLLVAFAGVAPQLGVFLAWTLPVVLMVGPLNLLIFRRLIPAHVRATRGRAYAASTRSMARYLAGDYAGYAFWSATVGLLPLVVLHLAGPEATASYFVAWSIAYGLYLVSSGMGQSLLAEGALDLAGLRGHVRRTLCETLAIVIPGAAVIVLLAPVVLRLIGAGYLEETIETLRWLALSAVPYVVVLVHVNAARAARRMRAVVVTYASLCGLVVATGLPLLVVHGIEGLGWAWMIAQSVVATVIGVQHVRPARRVARALTPVLCDLGMPWRVTAPVRARREFAAALVGPAAGKPAALLRYARSHTAAAALRRHEQALRLLPPVDGFSGLVPRPLASGLARGYGYLTETVLPGVSGEIVLQRGMPVPLFLTRVKDAITPLHDATAVEALVGEHLLDAWVEQPIAWLERVARRRAALTRLRRELREALAGRRVEICFVHGDLWPGNVLLGPDGEVSGLIDWEAAREFGLARVDLMLLRLTTEALTTHRELGRVVATRLAEPGLDPDERTDVLLAWLHHVAANVEKSTHYTGHRRWVARNVDPVLGVLAGSRNRSVNVAARAWAPTVLGTALLAAGLVAWVAALGRTDTRAMTDLGLISVLPGSFFGAVLALTVGFALVTHARRPHPGLALAQLAALVAVLHATPSIVYGTLRYSWAYKHVGIVDYLQRHHDVSPSIVSLRVYHNWPGFFGLDALATELAGLPNAIGQAIWGPLFFNLLDLGALLLLFTSLTVDRRVIWIACWLYFAASWVGQDYYSPQAFALFEYLVVLAVAVRWLGADARFARPAFALALTLIAAIAVSHPLTGVMVTLALTVLVLAGVCSAPSLPILSLVLVAGWNLTFARGYVLDQIGSVVSSIRLPWAVTEESLAQTSQLSDGQVIVSTAGRGLVLAVTALAAIGVVRMYRSGRLERAAALLAIAPIALFAAGDYDGEMIFRIYLFALPCLALLAAHAFTGRGAWSAVAFATAASVMLGAFMLAYYGKDDQYAFTHDEVAASRWLYTHAEPGALLIEGTRDYPAQSINYERYLNLALAREPVTSHARFVAHPDTVFSEWMSDPVHPAAYLLITRSMKAEVAELGVLPPHSLDVIERKLLASPRFAVAYRNRDAIVFTLASPASAR